jgi:CRISPR-associated RAMP protein (TIGR02581 family)
MSTATQGSLDHSALLNRYQLQATLVTTTALHIGSGGTTDVQSASDMPIARDGAGRPYVPGSSFRGSLRSGLESLLRGIWGDGHETPIWACDPLHKKDSCSARVAEKRKERGPFNERDAHELATEKICHICNLFGHSFLASRVWVADLRLAESNPEMDSYIRDGVGLDRDLRSASRGILYQFEAVPAGARFELKLEAENTDEAEVGLLLTGLSLFDTGFLALGGKRARGLGLAQIDPDSLKVTRWEPGDFFKPKPEGEILSDLDRLREAAAHRYGKEGH